MNRFHWEFETLNVLVLCVCLFCQNCNLHSIWALCCIWTKKRFSLTLEGISERHCFLYTYRPQPSHLKYPDLLLGACPDGWRVWAGRTKPNIGWSSSGRKGSKAGGSESSRPVERNEATVPESASTAVEICRRLSFPPCEVLNDTACWVSLAMLGFCLAV